MGDRARLEKDERFLVDGGDKAGVDAHAGFKGALEVLVEDDGLSYGWDEYKYEDASIQFTVVHIWGEHTMTTADPSVTFGSSVVVPFDTT